MYSKQVNDDMSPVVNIYYQDNLVGMYKAKLLGESSVVLRHGAISFPVGTALKLKFRRLAERKSICNYISAIVRSNSSRGMLLSLRSVA